MKRKFPPLQALLFSVSLCLCGSVLIGCNGRKPPPGDGGVKAPAPRADGLVLVRPPAEADVPELSPAEARALFRLVRSDALGKLAGRITRETLKELGEVEIPPRLLARDGAYVLATLYVPGRAEPLVGMAAGGNLAFSALGAAHTARGEAPPETLKTARIRLDLAGGLTACDADVRLVPGVEGLASADKGVTFIPPDLFLGDDPTMADYLKRLVRLAGLPEGAEKKALMLGRFRALSLLEPAPGAEPVFLYRGNALFEPPSREACLKAARAGEKWLARALGEDGAVSAAYFPYANCLDAESKATVIEQALTAIALTRPWHEAACGEDAFANADKALAALVKQAVTNPNFKFAYFPDEKGEGYVGSTAVALLALCAREPAPPRGAPDAARSALMKQLAGFLLAQQTADGEFLSHFDPVKGRPEKKFAEVHFPGQAVLALARLYDLEGRKDERLIAAARKAAKRLLAAKLPADHFASPAATDRLPPLAAYRLPPADPWLMQALGALLEIQADAGFSARLLDMTHAAIAAQLKPGENVQPDLVGAIDENDPPTVAGTAAHGEALLAALRAMIAQPHRAADTSKIEAALGAAAKFVVQQQYRPENSYALSAPERAAGGFRLSPLAGEIRPDTAAHAAIFLREYAALK